VKTLIKYEITLSFIKGQAIR